MKWRDLLPGSWTSFSAEVVAPLALAPPAVTPRPDVVTAAALDIDEYKGKGQFATGDQAWQNDLWAFFETLGEFAFVVNWKSNMASRIRLRAGKIEKGADEPTIETNGTAAELVEKLGSTGGKSTLLSELMTQLSVPAEGWLVGETRDDVEYWTVKSNSEVRRGNGRSASKLGAYEVIDEYSPPATNEWRQLDPDSMIVRVWRPHPRKHNEAWSPAKSARTTMHELDLINRKIVAQYLSRLASAGFLILPDELEFPVRPEFLDAANPFFQELIAVATEAIKTPGSAAATVPIPLSGPSELIDKIRHLDMTVKLDDQEIEKRDSVLRRLATQLDVPGEILTGMGSMNHWGAWAIDEQAFKAHVAPDVELLCSAITVGYLRPRLKAMGEDPADWVVWYDASEVIQRPDKSEHADVAYKAMEIGPEAYRRELGFDEGDAPTEDELQQMLLKRLAVDPQLGLDLVQYIADIPGFLAYQEEEKKKTEERADKMVEQISGDPPAGDEPPAEIDQDGPPDTENDAPPSQRSKPVPQAAQTILDDYLSRLVDQAGLTHAITYSAVGPPVLMHPKACREHLPSCPFTHAFALRSPPFRPGTSGTYECRLTDSGALALGPRNMGSLDTYVSYTPGIIRFNGRSNGSPIRR